MAKPQKIKINIGDKLGTLFVLEEYERGKFGHRQYKVRCDCNKEYICSRATLLRASPRCAECARNNTPPRPPKLSVGDILNNWEVVSVRYDAVIMENRYNCRCLLCGNISEKNHSEIRLRKGKPCQKCTPDYHFSINGNAAYGILPNGEKFVIDTEDVERVSEIYWHMGKDRYIISSEKNAPSHRLHNYVMKFFPQPMVYIDHINRNRSDCRKSNLRIVTTQQNNMNTSIIRSSETGLRGITFDKSIKKYIARIGLNDKRIYLGSSSDPIVCAQMYNCAAPIIFGEFAGELNDVPEPPAWIKKKIEEKCKPYMLEALIATQPYGIFYAQKKGI